jgi:hypothetical protein
MEKTEQVFMVKFFFFEDLRGHTIHRESIAVLGSTVYLPWQKGHSHFCRNGVIPKEKARIRSRKVILTIFFTGVSLIILDILQSDEEYTHECSIYDILPDLG